MITKTATAPGSCRRYCLPFPNARSAFESYLRSLRLVPGQRVLLPAYVGWSSREGSGVFDPVDKLQLDYAFYRVDERLHIDLDDLRHILRTGRRDVLVLIHFFGYVDPGYEQAATLAREVGAFVVEDEAHAMLTDLVGGLTGRRGDVAVYSLHKLLPLADGGMLAFRREPASAIEPELCSERSPWHFDLAEIARRRHAHACLLDDLLAPLAEEIEPLWGAPRTGEIPQTYPVLIRQASRDQIYHEMNAAGFGVVSLYHTLVEPILCGQFPDSVSLSRRILNLPVHQDAEPDQLCRLVQELERSVTRCVGV